MPLKGELRVRLRRLVISLAALLALGLGTAARGAEPVLVGMDAEFGLPASTSAQAVERGILTAIEEINAGGGVLGGRPLRLVTRDNRSVPARSAQNLRELAAMKDMVAVFCGRFSPTVLESIGLVHDLGLILLDPWASADGITENGRNPNYVFRLSLKDRYAMPAMLRHAQAKGASRVGLLLINTGWGRSNMAAAERFTAENAKPVVAGVAWYNWGDRTFLRQYHELRLKGAQAIVLTANDVEGAALVHEVAALPPDQRLPIVSHWGVTGGSFFDMAGDALREVDFSLVQSFSFSRADKAVRDTFMATYAKLYGETEPERIVSPVGVGHAYDLTRILARAIELAGTTDRAAVRDALEKVRGVKGLVRHHDRPFTAEDHDALDASDVFMARFSPSGTIVPLPASGR